MIQKDSAKGTEASNYKPIACLPFVMVMIPLTTILRQVNAGYRFSGSREKVNHLLFMDDPKLYSSCNEELESVVRVVNMFSNDVGMKFGFDKCGVLMVEKGVKKKCEGIELPGREMIKEIDENGYKYLGVLDVSIQSKLYGENAIKGINSLAVSVIHYAAGIIDRTANELKTIDIRTRKIMTMAGMFHQKGDVDCLYLMRKDGGRGMISVEDCVRMEEKNLARYKMRSKERLFGVFTEGMEVEEWGKEYKKQVMVERKEKLKKKQVHGKIWNDIEEVGTKDTCQWLQGGYITKSMHGGLHRGCTGASLTNPVV